MREMPKPLKEGSRVALVAPSSPALPEKLERGASAVRGMGFEPVVYPSCRDTSPRRGYLAGASDEQKLADIHAAFADSSIEGIFCLRGGSGAGRLIRGLDAALIAANPKVFAGYSDITILHSFIARNCGFATYHAPMPTTDDLSGEASPTRAAFLRAVTSGGPLGRIENADGRPLSVVAPGRGRGELVGGNLALLCTTIGTAAEIETRGRVVLIEDIDEQPYSVDRMLTHLLNAGKLADAAAIIFGTFTNCAPPPESPERDVDTVIREIIAPLGVPCAAYLDTGHGAVNITLPLGRMAALDADAGEFVME